MFGYALNHQQERDILKLLGVVATTDRDVSKTERDFINGVAHDFNVSADGIFDASGDRSMSRVCESLQDEVACRIALIYAIRLAYIDGMYNNDEFIGIRALADRLGIQGTEPAKWEDWVRRGLEWEEEGRSLLGLPPRWDV